MPNGSNSQPARIWMGTQPATDTDVTTLGDRLNSIVGFAYAVGQREIGVGGFDHWQFVVHLSKPQRLAALKKSLPQCHWEPTRSVAAESYVVKLESAVEGSRFEFGTKPVHRNCSKDWSDIKDAACRGRLDDIPPDIYIRCYQSLKRIAVDHMEPVGVERQVFVYWGLTGVGKSRRAWEEASFQAYPKDPRSKFWDGYRGQEHVVIDEFRGGIDVAHLLRWFDRYPVIVEVKGSSVVLSATKIWITSNLEPVYWYPELDIATKEALLRRLTVIELK